MKNIVPKIDRREYFRVFCAVILFPASNRETSKTERKPLPTKWSRGLDLFVNGSKVEKKCGVKMEKPAE